MGPPTELRETTLDANRLGGSSLEALRRLLEVPIAELDDETFTVAHALALGATDGSWGSTERATFQGASAAASHPPAPEVVKAAGVVWRRARRLLAGADLRAWLGARALDTARWRGHLERGCALVGDPDGGPGGGAERPDDAVLDALLVDLRCSGLLEQLADRLLAGAASVRALGARRHVPEGEARAAAAAGTAVGRALGLEPGQLLEVAARVGALESARAAFTAERVTDAAVDGRIRDRRLAWTVLAWEEVDFRREGAAREAAFMVELDGLELAEPAELAGCRPERHRVEVGRLAGESGRRLVGAVPRQVVGPWALAGRWPLLRVTERIEPSPDDLAHRERARAELLEELLVVHRAGGRVLA